MPSLGGSETLSGLPSALDFVFEEPEFLLGIILTIVIVAFPGGLASGILWVRNRARKGTLS